MGPEPEKNEVPASAPAVGLSDVDALVSVPLRELKKLEAARLQLYLLLEDQLENNVALQMNLQNLVTDQMWRVANTKKW